jgi:DNA repair protein RadC
MSGNTSESGHQWQIDSLYGNANRQHHRTMNNVAHRESTDIELLSAIISANSASGREAATRLIQRFGSLRALLHADKADLLACHGIGRSRLAVLRGLPELAGTIDGTSVYPREVVKEALAVNAAAVILAHNHPSGVAEPSQADERITKRLKSALDLVDIRLLDHLIVGEGAATSLASRGLL